MDLLVAPDKAVMMADRTHYRTHNDLDIVDCLQAADTLASQNALATFDRKIGKKIAGMTVWEAQETA